jgi:hypothetical protein
MDLSRRAAICVLTWGDELDEFERRLGRILPQLPPAQVELRLGFSRSPRCFHYTLGLLCTDGATPDRFPLPGGIERFQWRSKDGLPIRAWVSPTNLAKDEMARLLYHDDPLESEFAVFLGDEFPLDAGWWETLAPLLDKGLDYLGRPAWRDYLTAELENIQTYPWYMGVTFAKRDGRLGVPFMSGPVVAVRSQCLRQANFPQADLVWRSGRFPANSSDALLGEIARQLGWKQKTLEVGSNGDLSPGEAIPAGLSGT